MVPHENTTVASENLGPTLIIVAWVFAAIAISIIAVRCYVRLRITNRFQIDDWLILFTLVFNF